MAPAVSWKRNKPKDKNLADQIMKACEEAAKEADFNKFSVMLITDSKHTSSDPRLHATVNVKVNAADTVHQVAHIYLKEVRRDFKHFYDYDGYKLYDGLKPDV
ncbi:hypothetical protein BDZ91DRAFT_849252 [Kalaharituber pfeilii]|nr:hypothetical protein BDZ91DRAFT_849252 [Kalaharituber pfeilii]